MNCRDFITNQKNITRMMQMVDNPHNGVTFCSGSYGTNPENNLPEMIRSLKGRIHFAHVRNLRFNAFERPDGSAVTSWTGEKIKQGKPDFEEACQYLKNYSAEDKTKFGIPTTGWLWSYSVSPDNINCADSEYFGTGRSFFGYGKNYNHLGAVCLGTL